MGNIEASARNNGFNWYSSAEEVATKLAVSLRGKNAIVTGASAGIGVETARVLAQLGAHVTLAVRDVQKGQAAVEKIRQSLGENASLEVSQLDLTSFASIRAFASRYTQPLHILINNAATMATPYSETHEGFELQFGTNHIGHFLLVKLLLPRLKEAVPSARVICVASTAHRTSELMFDDISGKGTWYSGVTGPWKSYGQSKTANILFAYELNRRMAEEGTNVAAYSLHPGAIRTELQRHLSWGDMGMVVLTKVGFFKTIGQGAATSVYLAIAPDVEGNKKDLGMRYFSDSNRAVPAAHINPENAKRLWDLTEELIKDK